VTDARYDEGETAALARFVADSRWDDLPAPVRHEAKRALLNWLGCALGGAADPAIVNALAAIGPYAGVPRASVIGYPLRIDAPNAALVNAMASNILDFDDTHLATVIHPSPPIAPAVLAIAEAEGATGPALLHAFALGVDVACRVGTAAGPEHYAHGWHISGTCGVFGAAAAVGKLLGLDAARMNWAFGLAATQAAGLVESLGSMAKSWNIGAAAKNGLTAALLARTGFTASTRGIEAPRGFAHVLADGTSLGALLDDLGSRWYLLENAYKPYPCGVVVHPVIDACLALRAEPGVTVDTIRRLELRLNALAIERADRPRPRDGLEAKLSLQYCAACAIHDGTVGVAQFDDARVADPLLASLAPKVGMVGDPSVATDAAHVIASLHDGRVFPIDVPHARGSVARPLTDAEIEAKFRALASATPWIDAACVIEAIWQLDRAADGAGFVRLLRRSSQ
jgi:2-methylcitrate dehydratase PrpD